MKETEFKIGDRVIIDNLRGCLRGNIGHIGVITKKSVHGIMFYLDPPCPGVCFYAENLRLLDEDEVVETMKTIDPILIKVPKI